MTCSSTELGSNNSQLAGQSQKVDNISRTETGFVLSDLRRYLLSELVNTGLVDKVPVETCHLPFPQTSKQSMCSQMPFSRALRRFTLHALSHSFTLSINLIVSMFPFSKVVDTVLYKSAVIKYWNVAFVCNIEMKAVCQRDYWNCNEK